MNLLADAPWAIDPVHAAIAILIAMAALGLWLWRQGARNGEQTEIMRGIGEDVHETKEAVKAYSIKSDKEFASVWASHGDLRERVARLEPPIRGGRNRTEGGT